MIPKILHFVWTGPPLPDWATDNMRLFQELNPEFLCKLHGEDVLLPCLKPVYDTIDGEHLYSRRSDVLRVSALLRHGGWYFDMDFLPVRSLSELYVDKGNFPRDCYVSHGDDTGHRHPIGDADALPQRQWIANGLVGTTANSPFLACILRGILINQAQKSWDAFGPKLFTETVEEFPGIAHVGRKDDWYRLHWGTPALDAYKRIRATNYSRDAIIAEIGEPLPYAMHVGMQDRVDL